MVAKRAVALGYLRDWMVIRKTINYSIDVQEKIFTIHFRGTDEKNTLNIDHHFIDR